MSDRGWQRRPQSGEPVAAPCGTRRSASCSNLRGTTARVRSHLWGRARPTGGRRQGSMSASCAVPVGIRGHVADRQADVITFRGVVQAAAPGVGQEPAEARACNDRAAFQQLQVTALMNRPGRDGDLQCLVYCGQQMTDGGNVWRRGRWRGGWIGHGRLPGFAGGTQFVKVGRPCLRRDRRGLVGGSWRELTSDYLTVCHRLTAARDRVVLVTGGIFSSPPQSQRRATLTPGAIASAVWPRRRWCVHRMPVAAIGGS